MDVDINTNVEQGDRPLTRVDIERLLHEAGSSDKLILRNQNMNGIDLYDFDLHEADLSGANLSGARFGYANLSGARLSKANLSDADLSGANLGGALLGYANLSKALLRRARLNGAHLSYTRFSGANLSGANLSGADLSYADLSGADLSKARLRGADLSGALLRRARLNGAHLRGTHLRGTHLNDARLRGADLSGAFLNDARLNGADLSGALLNDADLSDADLSGANLSGARLRGADLSGANLSGAIGLDELKVTQIENASTFRIRIMEEPLTPHNLTSIISTITTLSTKCWLIANRRFSDLIEFTQTNDVRFVEETQLIISKMTHNSPLDASFKIDLSASNIAEAITTAIDGVTQVKKRFEKAELENKAKAQEIEYARQKTDQESKVALLEQERQELAIEKERLEILEKRLDVQKKGIEYALEIAVKTVTILDPNADEQTKAMLIQTLLPTLLQLQNGKGLELVLPAPQSSKGKKEGPENS